MILQSLNKFAQNSCSIREKKDAMLFYNLTKHVLSVIQIRFQDAFELSLWKQNT